MILDAATIKRAHVQVGERLAEMVHQFRPGGTADESYFRIVEDAVNSNVETFIRDLKLTADDAFRAKAIVGATMRRRYAALCKSADTLRKLCAPPLSAAASQGGAGCPTGRSVPPRNRWQHG